MITMIVLLPVDDNDKEITKQIEGKTFEDMDDYNKQYKNVTKNDYVFPVDTFACKANDQEVDLEHWWLTYVYFKKY